MEPFPHVPSMDYEEIRKKADSFLEKYHPFLSIPIPIDVVAEQKLKLDIVPLPGLYNVLDMDGFLYGDLSTIAVDEDVFAHPNPVRYRFTLAHEIGHLMLHPQLFKVFNIRDIGGWQTFVKAIPENLLKKVEWQAYCFAGLVLVPQEPLKQEVERVIGDIRVTIRNLSNDIKVHANLDFLQEVVAEEVAKTFEVSSQVTSRRMKFDGLDKLVLEM